MAITTRSAHVNRALNFFYQTDVYFAIAKSTPWPDEKVPPAPADTDTALLETIGYKKVENMYLVVPDDNGTISYRDSKWRVVPPDQALAQGAKYIYIDTTIRYDELPLGDYRQVGVFTGLTRNDGVSSAKYNLLPSEVQSPGTLEVIDNRVSAPRQLDQKEKLSLVIQF